MTESLGNILVTIKVFRNFFQESIDFYANITLMNQFPESRTCLYFLTWIFQSSIFGLFPHFITESWV